MYSYDKEELSMMELVTGFIPGRVRLQAIPWRTFGKKKKAALVKACSEYLDSLSQLSFHHWFHKHSSANEVCYVKPNGEHTPTGPF